MTQRRSEKAVDLSEVRGYIDGRRKNEMQAREHHFAMHYECFCFTKKRDMTSAETTDAIRKRILQSMVEIKNKKSQ